MPERSVGVSFGRCSGRAACGGGRVDLDLSLVGLASENGDALGRNRASAEPLKGAAAQTQSLYSASFEIFSLI
ncbi:hypothetical protein [Mesorhizobium sp. B2-4-2]|uniref:hypothetical protein n=1 Tax=Mesorhizobium sp. B2-4-2 TaxID=2589947 RepID=UPI0015E49432|nr:hypothetical protein [Mesorhizobium sp. B2-4-2]